MLFLPSWFLHVMAAVLFCCRSPVLVLGDPIQYTSPYSEFDMGNETQKPLYSQTDLVMIIHLSFASPYVLVTFLFFQLPHLVQSVMEAFRFCHPFGYLFSSGGSHVHVHMGILFPGQSLLCQFIVRPSQGP